MTTIQVSIPQPAHIQYPIIIKDGLLKELNPILEQINYSKTIAVIYDKNLEKFAPEKLLEIQKTPVYHFEMIPFTSGEESKNLKTIELLVNQLSKRKISRADSIITLGGGATGDIAGFAASIYLRGIPYLHIPTSLLSMIDSSIGGKNGVNLENGKNLAGTICQPKAVLIDTSFLKSLPESELHNGLAEMVKSALIADADFFTYLEINAEAILQRDPEVMNKIITRTCEIKKSIIERDEKENDYRLYLNYGHTIGHAIEKLSNYTVSHGRAITVGMKMINQITRNLDQMSKKDEERINNVFKKLGLNDTLKTVLPEPSTWKKIWETLLHDKKASRGLIKFITLQKLGEARINTEITEQHLNDILATYE